MTHYFLGIDVGGSKSHALIADETGQAVGFAQGGRGSPEIIGYDGLAQVLTQITDEAAAYAGITKGQIAGTGLGIAGYDWPCDREPTLEAIETLNLTAPFAFVNDAVIGLLAGTSEGWGVAVVAGTGCNCRGRDRQGREGRVVGGGTRFAEHCGASELVARAIQAVSLAWSQRGPGTLLLEVFMRQLGVPDAEDMMEGLYRGRYWLGAEAAPLVFQVAEQGDAVALDIIRWAGRELGSLAVGVIRQLGFEMQPVEIVLLGSLYKGSPLIVQTMSETVHAVAPEARLVRLEAPPVIGSVALGMEQAHLPYAKLRPKLIESTQLLLKRIGHK